MKKYYVLIGSKKQAEQYKYILTAAGIDTSNFVIDDYDRGCREIGYSGRGGFWLSGGYSRESNFEKVSIGQLIDLLNEPKKIAVKVENEKEFKALMKYYDSMGYKSTSGEEHDYSKVHNTFEFEKRYTSFNDKGYLGKEDYQIIPFSEFAAEHGIKLPLLTSEDGVDLYDGNNYFRAGRSGACANGDWKLYEVSELKECHFVCSYKETDKAFGTKQAALDWIEAQKPKEKEIWLFDKGNKAVISKDRIQLLKNGS